MVVTRRPAEQRAQAGGVHVGQRERRDAPRRPRRAREDGGRDAGDERARVDDAPTPERRSRRASRRARLHRRRSRGTARAASRRARAAGRRSAGRRSPGRARPPRRAQYRCLPGRGVAQRDRGRAANRDGPSAHDGATHRRVHRDMQRERTEPRVEPGDPLDPHRPAAPAAATSSTASAAPTAATTGGDGFDASNITAPERCNLVASRRS